MKEKNDRIDKLDSLIDEALTSYTPRAERPGLEQRVLASIASAELAPIPRPELWNWKRSIQPLNTNNWVPHPSRVLCGMGGIAKHYLWTGSITGVLAACALLLAVTVPTWIGSGRPQSTAMRSVPASRAESSPQAKAVLIPSTRPAPLIRSRQTLSVVQPPPQPQFGLPRPTKETLLMARFAAHEPKLAAALVLSETDLDAPITIKPIPDNPIHTKPIEIKPITVEPIQISSLNPSN